MQFGIIFPTRIDDWQLVKDAEDLGYDRAWVPDSQMIWSDWLCHPRSGCAQYFADSYWQWGLDSRRPYRSGHSPFNCLD